MDMFIINLYSWIIAKIKYTVAIQSAAIVYLPEYTTNKVGEETENKWYEKNTNIH